MGDSSLEGSNKGYTKVTEKQFLTDIVRSMSRIFVEKTHGQEVVWKLKEPPKLWLEEVLGPWKNPTEIPKDGLDLLKKKFEFLREHTPPGKLSESQKQEIEFYRKGNLSALSDLSNLEKCKSSVEQIKNFVLTVANDELVVKKKTEIVSCLENLLSDIKSNIAKSNIAKRKHSLSPGIPAKKARRTPVTSKTSPVKMENPQLKQTQGYREIKPKMPHRSHSSVVPSPLENTFLGNAIQQHLQTDPSPAYGSTPDVLQQNDPSSAYGSSPGVLQQNDPSPAYGSSPGVLQQNDPSPAYGSSPDVLQQNDPSPAYGSSPDVLQQNDPSSAYGSSPDVLQQNDPSPAYGSSLDILQQQQSDPSPAYGSSPDVLQQTDPRQIRTTSVDSGFHSVGVPSQDREESEIQFNSQRLQETDLDFLDEFGEFDPSIFMNFLTQPSTPTQADV